MRQRDVCSKIIGKTMHLKKQQTDDAVNRNENNYGRMYERADFVDATCISQFQVCFVVRQIFVYVVVLSQHKIYCYVRTCLSSL